MLTKKLKKLPLLPVFAHFPLLFPKNRGGRKSLSPLFFVDK